MDLTDVLDLAGIGLLIAAAYVAGGLWLALVVAGVACLAVSWAASRRP